MVFLVLIFLVIVDIRVIIVIVVAFIIFRIFWLIIVYPSFLTIIIMVGVGSRVNEQLVY